MSHGDYIRPGGVWGAEWVPGSADWQRFDVRQSRSINGDDGGFWTPSSPIILGGAGVQLTTSGSELTGGVTTKSGGRILLDASSGDLPTIASAQSDTVVLSMLDIAGSIYSSASLLFDDCYSISLPPAPLGVQTTLSQYVLMEIPGRYLHQGASFSKMVLSYRVATRPTALPAALLQFWLVALNPDSSSAVTFSPPSLFATGASRSASSAYALGAYVMPALTTGNNGLYYKCTTAGTTSSATSLVWPTTIGATVGDGTVTWTCWGYSGSLSYGTWSAGPTFTPTTPAAYYASGASQQLELDFDTSVTGGGNVIDATNRYGIIVQYANDASSTDPTQNIILESLAITYGKIATMRFP